jgi:hypothetical protein
MEKKDNHESVDKVILSEGTSPAPVENNRLSAETLFSFALPEAVIKDAMNKAKSESILRSEEESDKTCIAPKYIFDEPKLKEKILTQNASSKKQASKTQKPSRRASYLYLGLIVGSLVVLLFLGEWLGGQGTSYLKNLKNEIVKKEDPVKSIITVESTAEVQLPEELQKKELTSRQREVVKLLFSSSASENEEGIKQVVTLKDDLLVLEMLKLARSNHSIVRTLLAKALTVRSIYSDSVRIKVVESLVVMLEDEDYLVRGFSARALGLSGEKSAISKLSARFEIESEEVVRKLIKASIEQLS